MDFSIIIVNYNSDELLYNCVNSIINNINKIEFEIIVVDNSSTDNSFTICKTITDKRLKLIESGGNLGFARANNLGVKESSGRILHFLNPDTELDENMVNDYHRILDDQQKHQEYVYVNPMKNLDGTVNYGKNFIPDTLNYFKYLFNRKKAEWYYIGATVIMSRKAFDAIGGWNDHFFMYEEDTDLFYRINKHKIQIIELPTVIFHLGGGTSQNAYSSLRREILIQKSLRIYFKDNHLGWFNYVTFQTLMVLSFAKRPKRAWMQIKAIYKSFGDK